MTKTSCNKKPDNFSQDKKFIFLNQKKGFTLIEVIVSLAVISILILGVYSLVILSLKITSNNKRYVEAVEIANQKMEQIRNMPYNDVGTASGTVPGLIPQIETINRGGIFTITSNITYFDDPYDNSPIADTIVNDYKIATIKVSWVDGSETKDISVFSKIIPRTKEVDNGYGLLELHSVDANGAPVPNANVHIINSDIIPNIDDNTNLTNAEGILNLPLKESFQNYKITVSKGSSYSTAYSLDPASELTPIHLSITEGNKTAESFSIDKLSVLTIKTYTDVTPANWMVNKSTSTTNKLRPGLSKDESGNIFFIWQDTENTTKSSVYVQKFNSAKVRQWTNDIKVDTTNYQTNPSIATSKNGSSFVVWQDNSITLKTLAMNPGRTTTANNNNLNDYTATTTLSAANKLAKALTIIKDYYTAIKSFFSENVAGYQKALISKIKHRVAKTNTPSAEALGVTSIIQTKIGPNTSTGNTLTATFDNNPASGNVIIAIAVNRQSNIRFDVPYNTAGNFTQSAYSNSTSNQDVGIWHKVTGSGEPKLVTIKTSNTSDNVRGGVLMIMEVAGLNTANLIDVISTNDQNNTISLTADTGSSANSMNNGFGVAAIAFADNDFNEPTSANWNSISPDSWIQKLWQEWSTEDGSLAVATIDVTSSQPQRATLTLTGGWPEKRNSAMAVFKIAASNITTSATGSQITAAMSPKTNHYVGGSFILTSNGVNKVNSIKISENGTVDAQNNLENIKLYYDTDTSAPYDCSSEQYNEGFDAQFGITQNFDGANGSSTFSKTGGVEVSTTKTLCVYTVLDIKSAANKDETIEIQIHNPNVDITIDAGIVAPAAEVSIFGTTNILKPAELQQVHYRFRNDDGDEANATWSNNEDENAITRIGTPARLRLEISNNGSLNSSSTAYRIEYGEKITTCDAVSTWHQLPTDNSADWKITDSSDITDGTPTTNISGIYDENSNFQAGEIKDTNNMTANITLTPTDFTEIEYSIEATNIATEKTYCFRLTNAGVTAQFNYIRYPEATLVGDDNIFIKSFDNNGNEIWGAKRVHLDNSSFNQQNPQIALTENFGNATTTIVWEDSRNGNIDVYAQSFDKDGNRLWANDLQITSSSSNETSPIIDIDANDNLFVSWENQGDIYLQKYDRLGAKLWTNHLNMTNSSDNDFRPKITHASTTDIFLSWTSLESLTYNIYLAKLDNNGNQIWKKTANSEAGDKNQYYTAITNNETNIYIAWTDSRNGNNNIYSQKLDFSGNYLWPRDQKISDDTDSSEQNSPTIIINSNNDIFSAWHDERNLSKEIYAAEVDEPGALTPVASVPLVITGSKQIFKNPVQYKYDQTSTTDSDGDLSLQLEWDTSYQIKASSTLTSLVVTECRPINCPISINANETKSIEIYVK